MTKDLQEKCEYHCALSKYLCLHFLIDLISTRRLLISVLDAFQEVMSCVFKLLFHADDDAKGFRSSISSAAKREQNRHGHPAQHQAAVLNLLMLRKGL